MLLCLNCGLEELESPAAQEHVTSPHSLPRFLLGLPDLQASLYDVTCSTEFKHFPNRPCLPGQVQPVRKLNAKCIILCSLQVIPRHVKALSKAAQ